MSNKEDEGKLELSLRVMGTYGPMLMQTFKG